MSQRIELLIVGLLAAIVLLSSLGSTKLWDRDEPRNAGCAREMLERGDLITPVFNSELRDAKPVFLYWVMIASYQLFGITEFAARFGSALAGIGTVYCTYFIGKRLFDRSTGLLAAVVLLTSMMFCVAARAATPDSLLIFFSTAALATFVHYTFPLNQIGNGSLLKSNDRAVSDIETGDVRSNPPTRLFPISLVGIGLMYALMGFGVLTKGPIAFLMPTAIIGMYLLIMRKRWEDSHQLSSSRNLQLAGQNSNSVRRSKPASDAKSVGLKQEFLNRVISFARLFNPIHFLKTCWSMRLITGLVIMTLIAGPWYYLVGQQTDGEFLRSFFLKEHLGRSTMAFENHSGSIFYYVFAICAGFFPWSVFAAPYFFGLFQRRNSIPAAEVLLLCWVGVQVGLFTLVQTKLPSYVTPCYPALAMIVASFLVRWANQVERVPKVLLRVSFGTTALAGALVVIGIGYAAYRFLDTQIWFAFIGLLPLAVGLCGMFIELSNRFQRTAFLSMYSGVAVLFAVLIFGPLLTEVGKQQHYDRLLSHAETEDAPIGTFGILEPTWVFYGGNAIFELNQESTQVDLEADLDSWKPKSRPGLKQFLLEEGGVVITHKDHIHMIESKLGTPIQVVAKGRHFLKDDELVLIRSSVQTAKQDLTPNQIRR